MSRGAMKELKPFYLLVVLVSAVLSGCSLFDEEPQFKIVVSGTVTSELDGAPITGVPVELRRADPEPGDLPAIVRTDLYGRYTVKQRCDRGFYHLWAQYPGYHIWSTLSPSVWECTDLSLTLDIIMVPCTESDDRVECVPSVSVHGRTRYFQ